MNKLFILLTYLCIVIGWCMLSYMLSTNDTGYWWVILVSCIGGLFSQYKLNKLGGSDE